MNPSPKTFLIVHSVTLILSFFVIIPMSINVEDFDGYCLLYAQGTFTLNDSGNGSVFHLKTWGSSSNCNFVLYMGITILVASVVMLWRTGLLVWKEHDRAPFGSFIIMIGNGVIMFCMFVAALLTTIGFEVLCSNLFKVSTDLSCDSMDLSLLDKEYGITSKQFFSNFGVLQFGVWCSFCAWLIGTILAFFKVYYYHKNDDLMQSLAFEKETLLNRRRQYQRIDSDSVVVAAS